MDTIDLYAALESKDHLVVPTPILARVFGLDGMIANVNFEAGRHVVHIQTVGAGQHVGVHSHPEARTYKKAPGMDPDELIDELAALIERTDGDHEALKAGVMEVMDRSGMWMIPRVQRCEEWYEEYLAAQHGEHEADDRVDGPVEVPE